MNPSVSFDVIEFDKGVPQKSVKPLHPSSSGLTGWSRNWIPAFAGMTEIGLPQNLWAPN
jgi:hypothetical protein